MKHRATKNTMVDIEFEVPEGAASHKIGRTTTILANTQVVPLTAFPAFNISL